MFARRIRSTAGAAVLLAACVTFTLSGCEQKPGSSAIDPQNAVTSSTPTGIADGQSTAAEPKPVLKPGARTVVLAAAGDRPYDKTFDDLRFEMTVGDEFKREMLTAKIEAMNNQRIRIRGFILPTAQARGLKVFVLVRDNQVCCFGPGAALYDCILVEMQPGKTAEYTILPVTVEGTFEIQEFRGPDGKHLAIYRLTAELVE
jgi:hypothetical protein